MYTVIINPSKMRSYILILMLFELYFKGFCQFDQGVLLSGNNPLRLGNSINRTRFVVQCQPLNNGSGFNTITSIRIARAREFTPFQDVVSINAGQNSLKWQDNSVRDRRDVQKARITGPPGAAFIRYEIPPSRTDCTDAAYYRCIIDGTTLRFERVVFIQPEVEESYIEPLIIAPSNVREVNTQRPDTGSSVYTAGTSVWLYCTARTGNPPLPLRWCIDSGNGQFRQYISNTTRDFSSPGIGQQDRCILTSTSVTTYGVTDRDVGINIRLRCEIVNFNRAPCSSRNQLRDVTITGINKNNPNMGTTTRNPPVIIIDTGIVEIPSTTTPGIKIETEVVGIPSSTTPGMDLSARIESLPTDITTAVSTLIIGAILIVIGIICIVGALFFMLKARKIKKDAELAITRSTYDALNNKQQNSLDLYQTLNRDARTTTLPVDNEGYVLAR